LTPCLNAVDCALFVPAFEVRKVRKNSAFQSCLIFPYISVKLLESLVPNPKYIIIQLQIKYKWKGKILKMLYKSCIGRDERQVLVRKNAKKKHASPIFHSVFVAASIFTF